MRISTPCGFGCGGYGRGRWSGSRRRADAERAGQWAGRSRGLARSLRSRAARPGDGRGGPAPPGVDGREAPPRGLAASAGRAGPLPGAPVVSRGPRRDRPRMFRESEMKGGGGCGKIWRDFLWKTCLLPSAVPPVHSCGGTAAVGPLPAAAVRGPAPQDGLDRYGLGSRQRIRPAAWSARPPVRLPGPLLMRP